MNAATEIRTALGKSRESEALPVVEAHHAALDVDTAFRLGDQARRRRWYQCAIPLLARAEAGLSDPQPARSSLVDCHSGLRNWTEALRIAQLILKREPGHRRTLRRKAQILDRLGRGDEALAALEQHVRVAPRQAGPYADIARYHAARGEWERAVAAAREALAREPTHQDALDPLIDGLVALGREAESEEHFCEIARRDPNRVIRAVRMYCRMGRMLAAVLACRGLIGARGETAEVAATVIGLRSALAEADTTSRDLTRKQVDTALALLDRPVRPARKPNLASRIIANLTG